MKGSKILIGNNPKHLIWEIQAKIIDQKCGGKPERVCGGSPGLAHCSSDSKLKRAHNLLTWGLILDFGETIAFL